MYSAVPGAATLQFNIDALLPTAPPFRYEPDAIDPVLVEVLATAHFLSISPDLQRLESVIRAEQA
jgi:lysozyme family protein